MQRRTAADFPPEVLRLFDGYVHGNLTRREFLDRAARYATAGASAAEPGASGMNLADGDRIRTGARSIALITFLNGTTVTVPWPRSGCSPSCWWMTGHAVP